MPEGILMGFIRGWEWVIILVIVLLLLGPSKIPGLARAMGKSISEFRAGKKSGEEEEDKSAKESGAESKDTEKT
jgi:sec-independent protein translocase protein TatA